MKTVLGTEGGTERVILIVNGVPWGFYVAVRLGRRYYRFAMGYPFDIYVGRSDKW